MLKSTLATFEIASGAYEFVVGVDDEVVDGVDAEESDEEDVDDLPSPSDVDFEAESPSDFEPFLEDALEGEPYKSEYQPPPFRIKPVPREICRFAVS